jgi:hypothetical protein
VVGPEIEAALFRLHVAGCFPGLAPIFGYVKLNLLETAFAGIRFEGDPKYGLAGIDDPVPERLCVRRAARAQNIKEKREEPEGEEAEPSAVLANQVVTSRQQTHGGIASGVFT